MASPVHPSPASGDLTDDAVIARYKARYRQQDLAFGLFDRALGLFVRSRAMPAGDPPRRILLANAGHLGDVIITTALLPVLRAAFPRARLGFLAGNCARPVLADHPLLDQIHYLDHWYAGRGRQSRLARVAGYYQHARPAMVRELRGAKYDVALDLHAWLPNNIPLLWQADIPTRIGFGRVGFGPLLTHNAPFRYDRRPERKHQLDLLRLWGLPEDQLALARPVLPPVPTEATDRITALLEPGLRYHVLHPSASTPTRDWTVAGWTSLAQNLIRRDVTPVVTGQGERAADIAAAVCQAAPNAVNTVDQLTWPELMALLSRAELVYSVETSVGHAAAALGRPVVAIYGGMADPQHWAPQKAQVVTHPMSCAPCFRRQGCAQRDCLLEITVQDVEQAARLAESRPIC